MVMERFYGHRVDDVEQIRARNVDGEAKLLAGMRAWFRCLVFHGFFHGDVHAGNLMALHDGRIGFLDFGIVGRFTSERRTQITDYLLAFALGDFDGVVDVMIAMGSASSKVDRAALASDLKTSFEPMLGSAQAKYADMLPAILRTSVRHGLRLPREMVLVSKQMIYFDRYAKVLAPDLNVFRDPRIVMALAEDVMAARGLNSERTS
jgi:predicted unusual protein kinase regulating ubiquinone biosynthesis (AarF/ABC1/UbiB family)